MGKQKGKRARRKRVHRGIRRKVHGSAGRPRLSVYRSNNHIYAQLTDDWAGHTLAAASTLEQEAGGAARVDDSREVGKRLAERAREAGIEQEVFDRGGYRYHGRVGALAEGAREGGLRF